MLGDKRFLRTIKLRNILSFGPDTPELELQSLSVLIGPNGAGKSNLIEAIGLLQSARPRICSIPFAPVVASLNGSGKVRMVHRLRKSMRLSSILKVKYRFATF